MQRGRRLAFDYGDVRIGVAVCDFDAILASPLITLKTQDKRLKQHLAEIFQEFEPVKIYVGRPSNMDGSTGASAAKARSFCELIATLTECEVEEIDERLSTVSASKTLRSSGVDTRKSKSVIDQMAAVAILEFALSIERTRHED